jgi:hypothetical protein
MDITNKLEIVQRFLRDRHPRYANEASIKLLADAVAPRIPDNERIAFRFAEEVISAPELEAAFRKLSGRLADNYQGSISAFLDSHGFQRHQANIGFVADALERDGIINPTDEDCELLLDEGNPNHVAGLQKTDYTLQVEANERERQRLINEILGAAEPLVTGTGDREGERAKTKARAEWIERVRQSQLPDLQRIRAKQQLTSGSREDAKQIVKAADSQRQQEMYDGRYAKWPGFYVPPGKSVECAVPLTVQLFHRLPRTEIERLLRVFGQTQINNALAATQGKLIAQPA